MKKKIGNVGELDLTTATEESIQGVQKVGNVGIVYYRPETAHLLTKLSIGNLGLAAEVPEGYQLIRGTLTINEAYLQQLQSPLNVYVSGKVMIEENVTAELVESKVGDIRGSGKVLYPTKLEGVIQSKLVNMSGKRRSYPDGAQHFQDTVTINNRFLESLADGSTLYVNGKLVMIEDIDERLFNEKIKRVDVAGKPLLREDLVNLFREKFNGTSVPQLEVIPEGYVYMDEGIQLDSISIRRFKQAKLYTSQVIIQHDVTLELFQQHIAAIHAKDTIVCPEHLVEAIMERTDNFSAKILTYKDRFKLVSGAHQLSEAELQYTEGQLTFLVFGVLKIDADVSADMIKEKIDHIDNFGVIQGDSTQCGVIHTKVRSQYGVISDKKEDGLGESDEQGISNVGYLKL